MQRRDFLKNTFLSSVAVGMGLSSTELFGGVEGLIDEQATKLTILHTNDMHSRIEPFPEGSGKWQGLGGMAARASLIKKIRQEEKNVLLLDAGDVFQGTPYFNFFGGELEYKLMSSMGYDATTMGNHDFDLGLEGFLKQQPHAKFQVLVANYDFSKTILKDITKPYTIFQKGLFKVGVFGIGIELNGLVPKKLAGDTIYKSPIDTAKEMVQELKAKKCNLIICLSHLGYQYEDPNIISDHALAQQVNGIDLIIGGHTHTLLEQANTLKSPDGSPVLVNQVGWAGLCLGRIDFVLGKDKTKKMAYQQTILIKQA
jgi:5'-nucleotidase